MTEPKMRRAQCVVTKVRIAEVVTVADSASAADTMKALAAHDEKVAGLGDGLAELGVSAEIGDARMAMREVPVNSDADGNGVRQEKR